MSIITLTTDFGDKDYFTGAVKGAILSEIETVRIVDISHSISPFHIMEASYILKNAYKHFPKGTIHIVGVDSEETPETKHLIVELNGHFFILANNGILSIIAAEIVPSKILEITIDCNKKTNFPVLDIFVKVAAHLARGGKPEVVGRNISNLKYLKEHNPFINEEKNKIIGTVIYIDNYGNVITNIKNDLFEKICQGRKFLINARTTKFTEIFYSYSAGINYSIELERREEGGKKLAVFNSSGYLELAIYKSNPATIGSASTLFGLEIKDTVTVSFA